mmetsp:Transcript_24354/g.36125  ORF Transcript_24354/g.36125 Transcript_24354/m.36125 type:complete len:443 (+) Transcript_24354:68-1396(+)
MSGQQEESKKKRGAERQLTKDEYDEGKDDDDTADVANGEFKKADAETLATRRIVKVKRPGASESKQTNPFSAATLTKGESKSVFGTAFKSSGFGAKNDKLSFGSGSSGFGSAPSTNGTSLFGGDSKFTFGASKSTSVFGGASFSKDGTSATESSKFSFGKLNEADESKKETVSILPENVQVSNGEEGEECLMEVRVRSFEWVEMEERQGPKSGEEEAASMAVFSADKNGTPEASKDSKSETESKEAEKAEEGEKEDQETAADNLDSKEEGQDRPSEKESSKIEGKDTEKGAKDTSEVDGDSSEKEESKKESQEKDTAENEVKGQNKSGSDDSNVDKKKEIPRRWREMGIGPLRVLKASSTGITRVVQRRENAEGGIGTKVLVNTLLQKESRVTKQSEKHLQLATVGNDGPALYLLKVKPQDLSHFYDLLTTQIAAAKSAVAG